MMKKTCPKCNGNGYLRLRGYDLEEAIMQCNECNSQGEIQEEKEVDSLIPPEYQLTYQPILNPIFFG